MRNLSKIFLYFLFLAIVAEAALRLGSHFLLGTPVLDFRRFRSDPYVSWRFNPGYQGRFYTYRRAQVNSLGYLGEEIALPKPGGVTRVVALGGSVTFGYGVLAVEDNFCSSLEKLLNTNTQGKRYEVLNAGVPGYSSWNGRQWVEHYLADLQADVLLVAYGWNDSLLDPKPDADPTKSFSYHNPAERFPYNVLMLAGLFKRATMIISFKLGLTKHVSEEERAGMPVRVSPEEFRVNLEAIAGWCQTHGVRLILWTEPEANLRLINRAFERRTRLHGPYLDATRATSTELGVPLADVAMLFSTLDPDSLFTDPNDDYVHPDKRGQAQMAEIIYQKIMGE
jgi:lysophospholipase L1-like esterase